MAQSRSFRRRWSRARRHTRWASLWYDGIVNLVGALGVAGASLWLQADKAPEQRVTFSDLLTPTLIGAAAFIVFYVVSNLVEFVWNFAWAGVRNERDDALARIVELEAPGASGRFNGSPEAPSVTYIASDHDWMGSYKHHETEATVSDFGLLLYFSNESDTSPVLATHVSARAAYYGLDWELLQFQRFALHWRKHDDVASWRTGKYGELAARSEDVTWLPSVEMPPNGERFVLRVVWREVEEDEDSVARTPLGWYVPDMMGDYSRRYMFALGNDPIVRMQLLLSGLPNLSQRFWFEIRNEDRYPFMSIKQIDPPPLLPVWPAPGTQLTPE